MIRTLFLSLTCILFLNITVNAQSNPRGILENHKFTAINDKAKAESYFIVKDTLHQEFINGKLFAESKIEWLPGNKYNVVLKWMTPEVKNGPVPGIK